MKPTFNYNRGDLLIDVQLGGLPYRVERCLIDKDTEVALYVIKRVDDNIDLLRNGKLIDNPECFMRYMEGINDA